MKRRNVLKGGIGAALAALFGTGSVKFKIHGPADNTPPTEYFEALTNTPGGVNLPPVNRPFREFKRGEMFAFETEDICRDGVPDENYEHLAKVMTDILSKALSDHVACVNVRWRCVLDRRCNPDGMIGYFRFIGIKKRPNFFQELS